MQSPTEVRPFHIYMPQKGLDELHHRLANLFLCGSPILVAQQPFWRSAHCAS